MHRVELSFDSDRLEQDVLERLYKKTDEIFESEDLNCIDRRLVRVYADKGRKQDYGRFWDAIFALKESSEPADNLKECIWYNGAEKENLITEFLRNEYMDSAQKRLYHIRCSGNI